MSDQFIVKNKYFLFLTTKSVDSNKVRSNFVFFDLKSPFSLNLN